MQGEKIMLLGKQDDNLCIECSVKKYHEIFKQLYDTVAVLDMKTVAKTLAAVGYNRPTQY